MSKTDLDDPQYRTTATQQVAASCTGALITSIFVTPLDVVKIRLQAQQHVKAKCFLYCNGLMDHICACTNEQEWFRRPGQFTGTYDAFVKITRAEGVASLWSGLGPTLVLAVPTTVLYFVTYEQLRFRVKDWHNSRRIGVKEQPFWIPIICGSSARVIAATTVSPLELIRTKMQSQRLSYMELRHVLHSLVKANGIFSLWKGLVPTLLRDVPFSAIYWLTYETLKTFSPTQAPSFWYSFSAGAASGALAALITIPFDVVKTHQQIDLGENQILSDKPYKSKATLEVIRDIRKTFGLKGLFTGLVPRLVKVAPACAIMISTFEHSKQNFAVTNLDEKVSDSVIPLEP